MKSTMLQLAPQARVIQNLKQLMEDGALSAGNLLPSERELSAQFQVNRGTVRRALQVLQEEGLLRSQNGRIRVVTRGREGALRRSVALIAPIITDVPNEYQDGGRVEFIGRGALQGIRDIGKHALSLNPDGLTRSEVLELAAERPFGVVISDIALEKRGQICSWFREGGTPVCVYGDSADNASWDRVVSDHKKGSYLLTQHLIGRGCRRILNLWIAPFDRYWNVARLAGYELAMGEAGLEPLAPAPMPPFPITGQNREIFDQGVRQVAGFLVEHVIGPNAVDGILVTNDNDYFGVAAACRLCGKEPQRDILIAGYDNYWAQDDKRHFEPTIPIATVDKRNRAMGRALVDLLVDRVNGDLPEEPQQRFVEPELILNP